MKKSLIALSATQLAIIRISIAAIAFTPIILKLRKEIDWSRWHYLMLVGITGSALPAFMYAFAQTKINSSTTGILNSLTPIFTFVIGVVIFKNLFQWSKLFGVVLGFLGAASLVLFLNNGAQSGDNNYFYAGLVVIGTMCYGISVNIINKYLKDVKSLIIGAVSFGFIGIPAILYLLFFEDFTIAFSHPEITLSLLSVFTLSLFGTFLASIFFFDLVQKTDAVFASSVAYLMPGIALLWGFVDGEALNMTHVLSLVLIIGGVYLIKK
jgi:drug/metabolite transporter (DMT)-like permease